MNSGARIQIDFDDDGGAVEKLVEFFQPVLASQVERREETATKAWKAAIQLGLGIVVEWAAARYVLDPLADRAEEWAKAVRSVWQRSGTKRPFSITIEFDHSNERVNIRVSETSDERTLAQAWDLVRRAHQLCWRQRKKGIVLDQIRIVHDGSQDLLVVGYEGNRPAYLIDLSEGCLKRIRSTAAEDAPSMQLWSIEQLTRRLTYLKFLAENGVHVSQDEIHQLVQTIAAQRACLEE